MLRGGVASCHRYGVCTVHCVECDTVHSTLTIPMACCQYTHHTYDMLPHHCITYNDVVFTEY